MNCELTITRTSVRLYEGWIHQMRGLSPTIMNILMIYPRKIEKKYRIQTGDAGKAGLPSVPSLSLQFWVVLCGHFVIFSVNRISFDYSEHSRDNFSTYHIYYAHRMFPFLFSSFIIFPIFSIRHTSACTHCTQM